MPAKKTVITLADARAVIEAALAKAEETGVRVCVTVLDDAGNVVSAVRMDGSPLMAAGFAHGKAYTAVGQGLSTTVWDEVRQSDLGFGGSITALPGFMPFGGGEPLLVDGELVGGIGVSGAPVVDVDIAVARAGAAVLT